ncbi:hypothetical protein [Zeaxanthinibacter enoshimensis]|uniref:hypothetical protein n=1 Tax=Zeaxanthinibacter enoshimensis TaxID=392009 RepID=UPI0035694A50
MGSSFGAEKLWDHADLTPSLSSNMWFIFYELDINPFTLKETKQIPVSDQFWMISDSKSV